MSHVELAETAFTEGAAPGSAAFLVGLLKQVEQSNTFAQCDSCTATYLTDGVQDELPPILQEICSIANEVLIDNDGHCAWHNHRLLAQFGFTVFPGETDSFGWLTGCIRTTKGIIVYG